MAANIIPTAGTEGTPYSMSVPLTSTEADLNGGTGAVTAPIATAFGQAICATISLSINGIVGNVSTYIVMQMDLGTGTWIDMNWIMWTGNQGTATFHLSNGIAGATSFQQTRNSGQPPTPQVSGGNQLCLGGRIRFVGKSVFGGGSSALSGVPSAVSATIYYKLLGLH